MRNMKVSNRKSRKTKKKSQDLEQLQNLKIQQCLGKKNQKQKPEQDIFYENSSEANWEIKNPKYLTSEQFFDKKSVYSNFSTESKKSLMNTLCKALQILRNRMPQRSLQQIIIRLYQAAQLKREMSSNGSMYRDTFSQFSRAHDFDGLESQGQIYVKREAENQGFIEEPMTHTVNDSSQVKDMLSQKKQPKKSQHLDLLQKVLKANDQSKQKKVVQNEVNYIYRPTGKEIVVKYALKDTMRTKFVNIEEETRYKDQRFVATSFINRGYGVCQCRKEIEIQGINRFMHRDTYKALSTSMMIFAFRKLESFIAIQCGKKIKFIDRHQMQSIYITLLNCKVNMQPQFVITLMKYIKACYGLEEVVIGQIQSVKLYLTCQKYLYGKNVTMEFLEKLGEIKHKKQIQQTLQYINNRSMRYQQRLITLRRTRKERKLKELASMNSTNNSSIDPKSIIFPFLSQVKTETRQSQEATVGEVKREESLPKEEDQIQMDIEVQFAKEYIKTKDLGKSIKSLKKKYVQLDDWNEENFQQLFSEAIRKSLQKIQIQAAIMKDIRVKWVKTLQAQFFDKILNSPFATVLRVEILGYYLLKQTNLHKLKEVITLVKGFVTEFEPYTSEQEQSQTQSIKKIIKENLIQPIKEELRQEEKIQMSSEQHYGESLPKSLKSIIEQAEFEQQLQDFQDNYLDSAEEGNTLINQFKDLQMYQDEDAIPQLELQDLNWEAQSQSYSNF